MKCDREEPVMIKCHEIIDGLNSEKVKLRKVIEYVIALPSTPAYSERRPLMTVKVKDINKMLRYIGEDNIQFWKKITEWPTVHQESDNC